MPVLAHFSRAVYDKLGHETVAELVDYLNQVYDLRAELDGLRRDLKSLADEVRTLSPRVMEHRHVQGCLPCPPSAPTLPR